MIVVQLTAEYYKALFDDSFRSIEREWRADEPCRFGFRWVRNREPFAEEFRVVELEEGRPALLFSVFVPTVSLSAGIAREAGRRRPRFELSMAAEGGELRLTAALQTDGGRESILEFVYQARQEFADLIAAAASASDTGGKRPALSLVE